MKLKKADILVFVLVLLLSLGLFAASFFVYTEKGSFVSISINNTLYCREELNKDTVITLENNTVTIKNGQVYMSSANCPDGICVAHKPIEKKGETIVCLPSRVVVEVE